jgi:RND superfamily putative drug exporter
MGLVIGGQFVTAQTSNSFSVPGTEGQRALDLLSKKFPGTGGATARIVVAAPEGKTLADPKYAGLLTPILTAAKNVPQVLTPAKPLSTSVVSKDQTVAFADLQYSVPVDKLSDAARAGLDKIAAPARKAGLTVAFSGGVTATSEGGGSTEILGVLVAAIVLMVTFGSVIAAGLPLLTAIVGVGAGLLGIRLLSGFISLSATAPTLALMLGLAVGIDYALFILSRHRQHLSEGMDIATSVATSVATAGSAVVFAGVTVFVALAGMVVVGIPFLSVMGLAAAGTIVVAVLIALTLFPAMLGFAGARVNKGRRIAPESSFGNRWVRMVTARPLIFIVVIIAGLVVIALPALNIRLALPDDSTKPKSSTERQAYDLLTKGFGPGFAGPLTIVVDSTGQPNPRQTAVLVQQGLGDLPDVAAVAPPVYNSTGEVSIISVTPKSSPSSERTKKLVNLIRTRAAPARQANNIDVLVTGTAAINIDVSDKLAAALPIFLVLVVGLALLLLLVVFRSIAVPLKAVGGFLLTIIASMGLVVYVFQQGHLGGLFGVAGEAPIISFLPILMIAILFGLAMDYEVFLVSRIHEDYQHTRDAHASTITGFRSSARVVTAAGLIMISVFSGFILTDNAVTKSVGLALAFGVLVDAFLVRMTLVPAVLALLGNRAWALPRWLDRLLPRIDIEGSALAKSAPNQEPVDQPSTSTET